MVMALMSEALRFEQSFIIGRFYSGRPANPSSQAASFGWWSFLHFIVPNGEQQTIHLLVLCALRRENLTE
jgi:hypothetical protein